MSLQFSTQDANTLCFQALRGLNIVGRGQKASAQQTNDALYCLNELLDNWSVIGAMCYAVNINEYNIVTPYQDFYTIGPGGDFDTGSSPRPVNITVGTYQITGGATPNDLVMAQLTTDEYARIVSKKTTSNIATCFTYQPLFPLGQIRFWPLPGMNTVVKFTSYDSFPTTIVAATTIAFPPGYAKALRYGLIETLAPMYGKVMPSDISEVYNSIKDDLMTANVAQKIGKMKYPVGMPNSGGVYDILTDTIYRGF